LAYRIISELGVVFPTFAHARSYLSLGLPTVPSNLSYWIVNSSDRYIISIFLGAAAVGYYSPGYTVGYSIVLAVTPVSLILLPTLSAYFDNHRIDQVKTTLSYCLKYFLALAIPAAFIISLLSKQILTILSTPEIAAQGYVVTPYMTASALLFGVYALIGNVLVLEKRTRVLATIWLFAAALNLVLTLFLIPRIGFVGAAIATLFSFAFVFALVAYTRVNILWSTLAHSSR
jgi:O-antigen/teichoic acid export membrane protein